MDDIPQEVKELLVKAAENWENTALSEQYKYVGKINCRVGNAHQKPKIFIRRLLWALPTLRFLSN